MQGVEAVWDLDVFCGSEDVTGLWKPHEGLGEVGGGVSLWKDGSEVALVELPIAGLMSDS